MLEEKVNPLIGKRSRTTRTQTIPLKEKRAMRALQSTHKTGT
jgi:hypothetical protein